ncbi:MAG: hypothetical protein ACPGES_05415, partial [Coraliomargarita sp.]
SPFHPYLKRTQGGLFSVTLSVAPGYPDTPLLSQGVLPYGVRTFLSSKRQANAHTPEPTFTGCAIHMQNTRRYFQAQL